MKKSLILLIAGIVLIGFVASYFAMINNVPKLAYVELETLYNDFPMKKELEAKLTNVQQARKNILDSLKIQLNAMSISIKSEKEVDAIRNFQIKKQEYLAKQENFEHDNQATTQAYSAQIWKQINQYVKDYGKQNSYTLLVGTDGSGTLLYADEKKNITTEVSTYINERYSGEKK